MKTESEIRAEIERARTMPTGSSQAISHQISYTQALEWTLTPSASPQTDEELVEAMVEAWDDAYEAGYFTNGTAKENRATAMRAAFAVASEQIERKAREKALDEAAARPTTVYDCSVWEFSHEP